MLGEVQDLIANAQSPGVPFDVCIQLCKLLLILHSGRHADLDLHLCTYLRDAEDAAMSRLCLARIRETQRCQPLTQTWMLWWR